MASSAQLTIVALSCRRTHLLRRILPPLRDHFSVTEPQLGVQWICFDNGSLQTRRELLDLDFDLLLLSNQNLGQGPAFNNLLRHVCTPYFMLLEDDWELVNPRKFRFVEECINFMTTHERVGTIKLDTCHFLDFSDRTTYSGPHFSANKNLPFYVQNPKMLWGGFCFPPAITRTHVMRRGGPCTEDQPFRRGWAESYCSAQFSRTAYAAKSPEMLLFKHIGEVPSDGWRGA
jgi:hypothetical protein